MTRNEELLTDIQVFLAQLYERMKNDDWPESGPSRSGIRLMRERIARSITVTD